MTIADTSGKCEASLPRMLLTLSAVMFALHFAWEVSHSSLFSSMQAMPFTQALRECVRATFGDVALGVGSYLIVAACARDARWAASPGPRSLAALSALGVLATIVLEVHAITNGRWAYAEVMPLVPMLDVGLTPLLQWIVVPPLSVLMTRALLARAAR